MVYRFKLVSEEVTNFNRVIEIDAESTFADFCNAILESVGYAKDELETFYVCDEDWERQEQVSQSDRGSASDRDIWMMDETPVGDLIDETGQHLEFVFDYMNDRSFYMELKEIYPSRHLSTPLVTVKTGRPPHQTVELPEPDVKETLDTPAKEAPIEPTDLDADFFGDSEYDEEDLDGLNMED